MMRRHMMDMHGLMMPPMMGVAAPHPPAAGPSNGNATADSEPEEMCLPPN
jgi:hypothetical protein